MARGWESKSVEAQQESRETSGADARPALSPEEAARVQHRQALELALARAQADLAIATRPAHQRMLESAIRSLRQQLQ